MSCFESQNIDTHIKSDGTFRAEYVEHLDDVTSYDIILEMDDKTGDCNVIIQEWIETPELNKVNDIRIENAISIGELIYFVIGRDDIPTFIKQRVAQVWDIVSRDMERAEFIGSNNIEGFTVDIWRYETFKSKRVRYEVTAYDGFTTVHGYGDNLRGALMDLPRNTSKWNHGHCKSLFEFLGVC